MGVVRQAYQLFAKPDGLPLLVNDLATPDFLVDFSAIYPDTPVLSAKEFLRVRDTFPWGGTLSFEPEEFLEVDEDHVLVLVRVRGVGQASGVPVENRSAHLFTLCDGRLSRIKVYGDHAAAFDAIGWSERRSS